jgi:hypothetical protein
MKHTTTAGLVGQFPSPLAVYYYYDKVQIWLRSPLRPDFERALKKSCHDLHQFKELCRFDPRYRCRLQLERPQVAALQLLAGLDGALLNQCEFSCDLVFRNRSELDYCTQFFRDHFLVKWHRRQIEAYPNGGFSTRTTPKRGERLRGHWFVYYPDLPCRVTREPFCFHLEARHAGMKALRNVGVDSVRDLITFDFRSYFVKSIKFYEINLERLGRFDHNKRTGDRRKKPRYEKYGKFRYNYDYREGGRLYECLSVRPNQYERTLQQFIDTYGRGPFLKPHPYTLSMLIDTQSFTSPEIPQRQAFPEKPRRKKSPKSD